MFAGTQLTGRGGPKATYSQSLLELVQHEIGWTSLGRERLGASRSAAVRSANQPPVSCKENGLRLLVM